MLPDAGTHQSGVVSCLRVWSKVVGGCDRTKHQTPPTTDATERNIKLQGSRWQLIKATQAIGD